MPERGTTRQLYHWLSVDAALVAVAWQVTLARTWDRPLNSAAPIVLGLSVWLTYVADRLYDVRSLNPENILSNRHRFTHKHASRLWLLWWLILATDLLLAFTGLTQSELLAGGILLGCSLIYTGANQILSKRFFPKELCVALIFVGGIAIFIPSSGQWLTWALLTLICLFNCLSIGRKEVRHDRAMSVHSLAKWFTPTCGHGLFVIILALSLCLSDSTGYALAMTAITQWLLYINRVKIESERYRMLADAALFIGPLYLILT